jgi:simple sugar transport system ATP-binding protein
MTAPILEMRNATKQYSGVKAVEDVSLTLIRGEVLAILGENGAGKSTLTKAMAGVVALSSGEMFLEGRPVNFRTPHEALLAGVAMVFQETSLVPSMTVAQNLFLGQERFFNRVRGTNIFAQQFLQSLNFDVSPTKLVSLLGAAQKQMVEIARAVHHNAKVIIFDEPTATLTPEEKHSFFKLIESLKKQSVSIIFISHALEEALLVADRIMVLRDGRQVITDRKDAFDREKIVRAMVGRDLSNSVYGRRKLSVRPPGRRVLSVQNLRAEGVKNNSLSVFQGQITGVFGLVGSGRTETFKVVFGAKKRDLFYGGEIILGSTAVRYRVPAPAVRDGIAYITEDRKLEGFFETMSIARNLYISLMAKLRGRHPGYSPREAASLGDQWIRRLNIKSAGTEARVVELSGGNQQKVVVGKSLVQEPGLVIFDEPTRGVDVGAIEELHALINQLADDGKAVVMISSYLPEVLALSDRILIFRQGKVVEEFSAREASEEKIMYAAIH